MRSVVVCFVAVVSLVGALGSGLLLGLGELDERMVVRARSASGLSADLSDPFASPVGSSVGSLAGSFLLPDLGGLPARLGSDPAYVRRLTVVEVFVDSSGALAASVSPPAPWVGFMLPRDGHGTGTPVVTASDDYFRVKLLTDDPLGNPVGDSVGNPTRRPGDDAGRLVLKVGSRVLSSWDDFAALLDEILVRRGSAGPPRDVILDARGGVPVRFVASAVSILAGRGIAPGFAAPEIDPETRSSPPGVEAVREAIAMASASAPTDAHDLPRVGVRVRADARAPWASVQGVLDLATRDRVRHFTLVANDGEREVDLAPPGGGRDDIRLQRPIIVLEEEVEIVPDDASGTTPR